MLRKPFSDAKTIINEAPVRLGVRHSKEFLRREFDFLYKTFRAFAVHEKNSKIRFSKIAKIAKSRSLTEYISSSSSKSIGSVVAKAYLTALEGFKENAENANEIAIYEDAMKTIKEYVRDRHLGFEDKFAVGPDQYNPIWDQDWYKSTLIVINLLRFAGRNPFTFDYLPPELFDANWVTGLYQPHHLDASQKQLVQFIEIMLLDPVWHARFGPLSRRTLGIEVLL